MVEKSDEKRFRRAVKGHHALFGLMVSKDIVVYTKDEFERATKDVTSFSYKIKKKGKRVYAYDYGTVPEREVVLNAIRQAGRVFDFVRKKIVRLETGQTDIFD